MPVFKGNLAQYNSEMSEKENLVSLIESHNELVKKISFTVNNLDEENLDSAFLNSYDTKED